MACSDCRWLVNHSPASHARCLSCGSWRSTSFIAWMADTQWAWLAFTTQSTMSCSCGPAELLEASALSRSATCSTGSRESMARKACARAKSGSALPAARQLSSAGSQWSVSILDMPSLNAVRACGDLVVISIPAALARDTEDNRRMTANNRGFVMVVRGTAFNWKQPVLTQRLSNQQPNLSQKNQKQVWRKDNLA